HQSGRHIHDLRSLLFRCLRFIFIAGVLPAAVPANGQAPSTTFRPSSSATASAQNGVSSPIPANSPFLGSMPTGKATPDTPQLTLREAIDRGVRYNLGLVLSGIS